MTRMQHPTSEPRQNDEEEELTLSDLLAQLLARKGWIVAATLIAGLVGVLIGQLPPNEYQARSVVQIEQRASGVQLPAELIGEFFQTGERESSLATEIHIINSRLILGPVVEELNTDDRAIPVTAPVIGDLMMRRRLPLVENLLPDAYARAGEDLAIGRLDLREALRGTALPLRVLEGRRYAMALPEGGVVEGEIGAPLTLDSAGTIRIDALTAPAGREFLIRKDPLHVAVARLRGGLSVRERGSSGIVDFRFNSTDPETSRERVNAIVASYQEQNLQRRSAEIDQSIAFIEEQLPEVRERLEAANAELSNYREERQSEELSLGTQELLSRAVELETQLEEINYRKQQMLQRLTENHPDYRSLIAEEERLQSRLAEVRGNLAEVPEAEQQLARLTQRVERARQLEAQLVDRVEQLRILRASTVGNIRVLDPAVTAQHVGPDRRMPAIAGAALGLVASALGIFLVNFLRRGVEDAREIEALGLPLFATINREASVMRADAADPAYGLALHDPQNTVVEALRGLRTGLQFSLAAAESNSLMITSCAPADGKSFIALNLAIVSARAGARVLLIDGDMRRGHLHKYFGLSRKASGLSETLAGSAGLAETLYHVPEIGLDFTPTGRRPPNPAELLASPRFKEFMDHVSGQYDLVIIDAPPALAVADPGIIGQHTGMSLLVVRHLASTKPEIQTAQKTLANSGVQLSGVLLNQFDQKRSRYGNYGTRYGYYYGGYKYRYD